MWTFVNDKFQPREEATLPITDLALQRGYAAFDYLRTVNGIPLFIEEYIERLKNSAAALRLVIPTENEWWVSRISTLIEKNKIPRSSGIRITITGGNAPDFYTPVAPNIVIDEHPLTMPGEALFNNGLHLFTYDYQRDLPAVKSINYLMAVWLQEAMKAAGADDILYQKNNIISELPRANIFLISDANEILTPDKNILEGIKRKKIVENAASLGKVIKKPITTDALWQAKEIFICSTTKRILPVTTIDNRTIGDGQPGPITKALHEQFIIMENEIAAGKFQNI